MTDITNNETRATMKKLLILPLALSIASCAFTYKAPTGQSETAKSSISTDVFSKAKRSLILSGYKLTYSDKLEGLISTDYKVIDVKPKHADCGKTLGLDYLKDNRTKTELAFTVILQNKTIEVKSDIKAEYRPSGIGGTAQGINLTCISKGVLEKDLLNKIVR